jgi:hypothetical protein
VDWRLRTARRRDDALGGAITLLRMRRTRIIRSSRMVALGPIRAAIWIRPFGVTLAQR